MALAAAHASSSLLLIDTAWMQRMLGHAAWKRLCQIASQWLKRPSPPPDPKCSCNELFACSCVRAGNVLSAQAG